MPRVEERLQDSTISKTGRYVNQFYKILEEQLFSTETVKDVLKRTLSVGTVTTNGSSLNERMNDARDVSRYPPLLNDIGRGSCGSVFEMPGTPYAIKKGSNTKAIWNDYNLTNHAYNSHLNTIGLFKHVFPDSLIPRIPKARFFNGPDGQEWWKENMTRFPEDDRTKAAIFHLDHILPVPLETRHALVKAFFHQDENLQSDILNEPRNRDCLIRLYFGANAPQNCFPYDRSDTLRNFPLYLDHAKMIGIDVDGLAQDMAIGLAMLHWDAQIDAQDTEFVIGSSTNNVYGVVYKNHSSSLPPISTTDDFTHREIQMWMLDFDKCTRTDLDSDMTVKRYLVAVTGNDPYFPHPRLDSALWACFRSAYLKASKAILSARRLHREMRLPQALVAEWEKWADIDIVAEAEFDPFERDSISNLREDDDDDGRTQDTSEESSSENDSSDDDENE